MRKTLVTTEYYCGLQEWYIEVIECPKCRCKNPVPNNFCGGCGVPFKLSADVLKFSGFAQSKKDTIKALSNF